MRISLLQFFLCSLILHAIIIFGFAQQERTQAYKEPVLALKINNVLPPVPERTEEVTPEPEPIVEEKKVEPEPDIIPESKPVVKAKKIVDKPRKIASQESVAINAEARSNYEQILAAWLAQHKTYPPRALRRRIMGEGVLYVKIDGSGKVLEHSLKQSTSSGLLDEAIISMLKRAEPLPAIPKELNQTEFDFVIPITFRID